jgi:futalosine hydrolase
VRILIVSATTAEVDSLVKKTGFDTGSPQQTRFHIHPHDIDLLVTGVGMVATAARCAQALARERYDVALNLGVCGSFDRALSPGTVVHVVTDRIAELGAEDDERFLTIHDLQLLDHNEFPFRDGRLVNDAAPATAALGALPAVDGISVNTVHGNDHSIDEVVRRFQPQVESMEGAAFMYACLLQGVRFAQVRAVSNIVERRNRDAWKLKEAIDNLGTAAVDIIRTL